MSSGIPADVDERRRALDTTRSFLVQAPAGAGKTELLVRRYLALLARADEPEEILAVTFTRKAAAEMQERVIRTLTVQDDTTSVELQALVAGVRRRDAERDWRLASFPARLRISTIDALNAALARSTPLTAGANVLRPIATDPERLYRLAARASVRHLADGDDSGAAVADLLRHLDNNPGLAENLLAMLLARRDQWLPLVGTTADPAAVRQVLEGTLARIVEAGLGQVTALLPPHQHAVLIEIVQAAALNLGKELTSPAAKDCSLVERHAWWQFAGNTLLTKTGEWRKGLNKTSGFPPDQPDLKTHATALLAELQTCPDLLAAMVAMSRLPPPVYPATQWRVLQALLMLLPNAVAELKLVFAAENATDYAEVAMEARTALGDDMAPSDLALRMDWRLQHILLDEFQDTSRTQYALLQALTRGWTAGDGRTLFLVGDPMQSIYRFRQAEVGLFIDVRDSGLPDVALEFLRLRTNFRSVPALIAWTNASFPQIFPPRDDIMSGAISFAPSVPARVEATQVPSAVTVHAGDWQCPEAEATVVLGIVQDCLAQWPQQSIGILVRSRAHAARLVPVLRAAGIRLAANELVSLDQSVLANDLLAITRALVHVGDRLAWMGVLRAPWCGLTLADLATLCTTEGEATLWEQIQSAPVAGRLSADGRQRLSRVITAFSAGLDRLGRIPLRDVVEGVWLALGGPAVAGRELPLADLVLTEIERHDVNGDCPDTLALARTIHGARGSLPDATACVQVMTIHKAKGLEFDTVILPGLGRMVRGDSRPVLLWQQLLQHASAADDNDTTPDERAVLLAPMTSRGDVGDPLYEWLWELRAQQALAETDRLLYVAVTRARERLHLLGQLQPPRGATMPSSADAPAPGSLLARLWSVVGPDWPAPSAGRVAPAAADDDPPHPWQQPPLRRLHDRWCPPAPPAHLVLASGHDNARAHTLPIYDWAGAWTRHAGTVAHRLLQQVATEGVARFTPARVDALAPRIRMLLMRQGVALDALDGAALRVARVLKMAIEDERGSWLLGPQADQRNEWAITVVTNGRFQRHVIDRAFIDADGIRWIIDYKTSSHEGGDVRTFIDSEVGRYAPQLQLYRSAVAKLEQRDIRTALYFPLLQHLQLVEADGSPG